MAASPPVMPTTVVRDRSLENKAQATLEDIPDFFDGNSLLRAARANKEAMESMAADRAVVNIAADVEKIKSSIKSRVADGHTAWALPGFMATSSAIAAMNMIVKKGNGISLVNNGFGDPIGLSWGEPEPVAAEQEE